MADAEKRVKELEAESAVIEGTDPTVFHEAEVVEVALTDVLLSLDRLLGEARSGAEREAARGLEKRVRDRLSQRLAAVKERAKGQ